MTERHAGHRPHDASRLALGIRPGFQPQVKPVCGFTTDNETAGLGILAPRQPALGGLASANSPGKRLDCATARWFAGWAEAAHTLGALAFAPHRRACGLAPLACRLPLQGGAIIRRLHPDHDCQTLLCPSLSVPCAVQQAMAMVDPRVITLPLREGRKALAFRGGVFLTWSNRWKTQSDQV